MDRQQWSESARENGGSQVVWIDQTDNSLLKAANSNGVCFAITQDWIQRYRTSLIARSDFVNGFRNAVEIDPDTHEPDPKTGIPADYLRAQDEHAAQMRLTRLVLGGLALQVQDAIDNGRAPPADIDDIKLALQREKYGAGLMQSDRYRAAEEVILAMKSNPAPAYYMLLLWRPAGMHVLGFEFRPDLVSGSFPGLFEFMDANLGLYAFPSSAQMLRFFYGWVWQDLYSDKGYTGFELVEFDPGTVVFPPPAPASSSTQGVPAHEQ